MKTKPQQKQNGGVLPKYETTLPLKEEANFMPWLESQYKAGNITPGDFDFYKKNNYGYNYDFRAAYKEGLKSSLNSKDNRQHWGDIGKKPNHPTFSNESKYHNVDGNIGGSWDGENFIPAQKQNGGTLPYVAPNLLEVEITPEGTELKDQPKELEAYYRDYAAQYPVTDKKDITKTISLKEWSAANMILGNFYLSKNQAGKYRPLEINYDIQRVSFDKGCFRGQEIIARMKYLGVDRRRFCTIISKTEIKEEKNLKIIGESIKIKDSFICLSIIKKDSLEALKHEDPSIEIL